MTDARDTQKGPAAATGRAFVATGSDGGTTTTGSVDVIDSATGSLVRTAPLPGGIARLAVDERVGRILATTFGPAHRTAYNFAGGGGVMETVPTGPGHLLILDARSGAVLHTVATGPGTTAVAVDTRRGRVFVASTGPIRPSGAYAGPGMLTVVDERHGMIVRRIPVNVNPTDLTFDERTQHLFIAYQGNPLTPPPPDPWDWMPGWLRGRLPFVPRAASRAPTAATASGGISILDTAHL